MSDEAQVLPVIKNIGYDASAYSTYTTTTATEPVTLPGSLKDWAPVYGDSIDVTINGCTVKFPCDDNLYKAHSAFIVELGKKLRFENSLPPIYTTTEIPTPPEPVDPVNFVTGEEYTKIYFNTSLSVEDTAAILADLTYDESEDTCVIFQIGDKLQITAATDGTDYMMVLSGVDGEDGHDAYIFSTVADTSETPAYTKGWQNLTEAGTFTSVYNIPTSEQDDLDAVENIDCISAASFEPEYIITDKGLVIDRNGNYIKTNPRLNNFPIINKL